MDDSLRELLGHDLEHYIPSITMDDIIAIFIAHDISFIRNFGSDLYYVEMVDGEPLVPMNPRGFYPPGIERLFDLMAKERISILRYRHEKLWHSYFQVNSEDL